MSWQAESENLATDLAFWHLGQTDPDYPLSAMGELSLEQARKFRALAIMLLMAQGSTDLFLHNLMRAARARSVYLRRVRSEGLADPFFTACGWFDPLVDAIAAGDLDTARTIALNSADTLVPGEYPEDHAYAKALHLLVMFAPDIPAVLTALDALEQALTGRPRVRLDVLRAIAHSDTSAFELAFDAFVQWVDVEIQRARDRPEHEDGVVLALREVSVEGLALLRLAVRAGVSTEREYKYCPSLARLPLRAPFREV